MPRLRRDANADLIDNTRGHPSALHHLGHDFVSEEIVYLAEGIEIDPWNTDPTDLEGYVNGDVWFKIFLDIDIDGHVGKYVATMERWGCRGTTDYPRQLRHTNLIREQIKARMLKAIIQPIQNPERVSIRRIPTLVRLYRDNDLSCPIWDAFDSRVESLDRLRRLGFILPDGELTVLSGLTGRFEDRRNKVVKKRAHMVDRLISKKLNNFWWTAGSLKAIEVICSFVVYLATPSTWIGRDESINDAAQLAQLTTCPAELEYEPAWWNGVRCSHESQRQAIETEDPKGTRNPRPRTRGRSSRPQESGEGQALNSEASPEEVVSQTEHDHPRGDCSATHTHLGSPEDV